LISDAHAYMGGIRDSCLSVNFNPSLHCSHTAEHCYNVLTSPDIVHIGPAKYCNSL